MKVEPVARRAIALPLLALAAFMALSCQSHSSPPPPPSRGPRSTSSQGASPGASPAPAAASSGSSAAAEAESHLLAARDALDANHLTEAIKVYVAVLGIGDEDPAASDAAAKADNELTKIASRLSLEVHESWLDPEGRQIVQSTRSIGKAGAIQPSVYLYENYGTGKAPVADATLVFEFASNAGDLSAFVDTDAYGMANTNLTRIADPAKTAVIRVYPLFRSRGRTYAFRSLAREFTYQPPSNSVLLISLVESGSSPLPGVLTPDILAPQLKAAGLDVLPVSGSASREAFKSALAGDAAVLAGLASGGRAGFIMLVFIDIHDVQQYEYKGKKYELYSAYARATARLTRNDGTIVHTIALERIKGDGGTADKAVDACARAASQELAETLKAESSKIKLAVDRS